MTDEEIRFRALDIAERSVHTPYIYGATVAGMDSGRDKDLREIFDRAGRIVRFVQAREDDAVDLLAKLKTVLCEEK